MAIIDFLLKIRDLISSFSDMVFHLIEKLQPFFKKDILFFVEKDSYIDKTEFIDAYSLFQKAREKGLNAYYLVDKKYYKYKEIKELYKNRIIEINLNMHIKHFMKFLRLSNVYVSFRMNSKYKNFFKNNKFINYIFIGHGIILLKNSIFDIYNTNEYDKILISNDYEAQIVKEFGKFEDNQLIKTTLPRFDLLKKEKIDKKQIFLFFTWRKSFGTVDYKNSLYYKAISSFLNNENLDKFLKENNVELVTSIHHALLEGNSDFKLNKNIKLVDSLDISKAIKSSSLLITDYSSVWSDFFFLNKPVVFYRPDVNDENLIERDRCDIRFAQTKDHLLFNIVYEEKTAIELVKKYVANNFVLEEEYKSKQNKFFYTKENIREKTLKETGF